jgi:8-amino-7-oxononanoate synthase
MEPSYLKKLRDRKEKGSYRSLLLFDGYADFWSNDYLGMARLQAASAQTSGSTGSRLISGNSHAAQQCEVELASFYGSESALVFNSGYDANVGLFSSLPQKGDTVLFDELIHASVRDGIRLSHARAYSFRHNDVLDLEQKWKHATGTVFVAVESLYSMNGDVAPLKELADWCAAKNALLIVDEAHSGGVFGEGGRGMVQSENLQANCFARVFTFGKAYGLHGAVICGNASLCDYLVNFARSFIYTTALPPAHYQALSERVKQVAELDVERTYLKQNISLFRSLLPERLCFSDPDSPIQIIPVSSTKRGLSLASILQENRFAVKAILPPTVPEGSECLRICLHAFNTEDELRKLTSLLKEQLAEM